MSETIALEAPTTEAPPCPTVPGTPHAGGYYVGRLRIDGVLHAVIVAPKAEGELRGAWHAKRADEPGARSVADGLANTRAMAEAGSTIAQQALACRAGGFEDWHIPARDALELMYRHLKPTTDENLASYRDGDNPSSEPTGTPYDEATPSQTAATAFRDSGDEAFAPRWHWSSTQHSAHSAYIQDFSDGGTYACSKDWSEGVVRLARTIPLQPFELQPLRREAPSENFALAPRVGMAWPEQGGIYMGIMAGAIADDGTQAADYHLVMAEAPAGEMREIEWGGYGHSEPGAASFSDGQANTRALVTSKHQHPAALACAAAEVAGHADWYLPALGELKLAFANGRQHFDHSEWYWSSTQGSARSAYGQYFSYGGTLAHFKHWSGGVVRLARRIPFAN